MIKVTIQYNKLKKDELFYLFDFLCQISDEVSFITPHKYHLSEEESVEVMSKYKQRCKDRHHALKVWQKKSNSIMDSLRVIGVKTDSDFEKFLEVFFQSEISLCKTMEEVHERLLKNEDTLDYKKAIPEIADYFIKYEISQADDVTPFLEPVDFVYYKMDTKVKEFLFRKDSEVDSIYKKLDGKITFSSPSFYNNKDSFAYFRMRDDTVTIKLDKERYKEFKKLKIKHKKEVENDDESLEEE